MCSNILNAFWGNTYKKRDIHNIVTSKTFLDVTVWKRESLIKRVSIHAEQKVVLNFISVKTHNQVGKATPGSLISFTSIIKMRTTEEL